MARCHVELCRHFASGPTTMGASTVSAEGSAAFDSTEPYSINRQPFPFSKAKLFANQLRWGRWLSARAAEDVDVLHCGNIRPCGYGVLLAHLRRKIPFFLYVYGGDLLKEQKGIASSPRRRFTARRIFGAASGIVGISAWTAALAADVMRSLGINNPPPIGMFDLGTDPEFFNPRRDSRQLRTMWNIGDDPLILTVARLVPHKGQDTVLRALAALKGEFPSLRYAMVGRGPDEQRLRSLATELGVADRAIFAGGLTDQEVAEAYATATLYAGLSRVEKAIDAEGFGLAFVEAGASGVPVIAGDSGGVRSAVRNGENGVVLPPLDVEAVVGTIRSLLLDSARRQAMGTTGRQLVEAYYNWERVARDTRDFTYAVLETAQRR
jgi:glycosyltransferase involved in cell wall biosynthesis